jgi:hypothetical protein
MRAMKMSRRQTRTWQRVAFLAAIATVILVVPNGRELREGAGGGEVGPEIYK